MDDELKGKLLVSARVLLSAGFACKVASPKQASRHISARKYWPGYVFLSSLHNDKKHCLISVFLLGITTDYVHKLIVIQ